MQTANRLKTKGTSRLSAVRLTIKRNCDAQMFYQAT